MTTANPGSLGNNFFATAVISASDAWAAGWKYELLPATARGPKAGCGCAHFALLEHWNGSTWSVVSHPDETLKDSQITGMAAIAGKDVWAVGYYTNPVSGTSENHVEHWNGSTWSLVPSAPVPQYETLSAVAGRSSCDRNQTLEWNELEPDSQPKCDLRGEHRQQLTRLSRRVCRQ
jgi:hypothetical protein